MSTTKEKSSKGTSKNISAEEHNATRREAKAHRRHSRSGQNAPGTDIMTAIKEDRMEDARIRKEAARRAFIEQLNAITAKACLVANELFSNSSSGRDSDIANMVIAKYYMLSLDMPNNKLARFEDAQKAIMDELKDKGRDTASFLFYATNRGFDAIKGGHAMMEYNKSLEEVVASIQFRMAQRKKHQRPKAAVATRRQSASA